MLPNLKTIIRNYLPLLCNNQQMLDIFPQNTVNVTYKRNKNLREILSPSLFPVNVAVSNILGLQLALKKDLEFITMI